MPQPPLLTRRGICPPEFVHTFFRGYSLDHVRGMDNNCRHEIQRDPGRGFSYVISNNVSTTTATAALHSEINIKQVIGLIGGPLVLIGLWFAPTHENPVAQHAIAISALMIVLWATEARAYALAGFTGLFLFWA